jgi:hypothetical protein
MSASSGASLASASAPLSESTSTSAASNTEDPRTLSKSQKNKNKIRKRKAEAAVNATAVAEASTGGRDYDWHHTIMARLFDRVVDYAANQKKGTAGNGENSAINKHLTDLLGVATGYDRVLLNKMIPHDTIPGKTVPNDRLPVPFVTLASISDDSERAFVAQQRAKFREDVHEVSYACLSSPSTTLIVLQLVGARMRALCRKSSSGEERQMAQQVKLMKLAVGKKRVPMNPLVFAVGHPVHGWNMNISGEWLKTHDELPSGKNANTERNRYTRDWLKNVATPEQKAEIDKDYRDYLVRTTASPQVLV